MRDDSLPAYTRYIDDYRDDLLHDLKRFVSIPGVSMTGQGIAESVAFVVEELANAGCSTQVYQTAGYPIIYARSGSPNAPFTLLIYGHYDVFPADDEQNWRTRPFEPVIEGDRIYGRGAGDNKGQILAHIKALKMYRQIHGEPPLCIKFVIEGEEETGSKNLPIFVKEQQAMLQADLSFYSDGPMFPGDQPVLLFGVRGALCLELVASGARRVLHSGNFGGIAPNPILDLCQLFAQMVAPDGRITVPGAQVGVPELTANERQTLAALPLDREAIVHEMGIAPITERFDQSFYERLLCMPSFNISGFSGGFVGQGVKTIIPNEASARVDIRLVGDQDPDQVVAALRDFAREQGFEQIEIRKLVGQPASKTPIDHPYGSLVREAVSAGFGRAPLIIPSLGATTPDYVFTKLLGIPSIVVPYAPHDENNHAPNESNKLSIYFSGIQTTALLLDVLGQYASSAE
jgi:acetylornithine deacetylase/succinyl-diaminopimelate desuccinylase-like protein